MVESPFLHQVFRSELRLFGPKILPYLRVEVLSPPLWWGGLTSGSLGWGEMERTFAPADILAFSPVRRDPCFKIPPQRPDLHSSSLSVYSLLGSSR